MSRLHFLVFSLCAILAGCGSSIVEERSLIQQLLAVTKETADLLATVKDRSSAQAAAPKLRTLIDRADKLTERLEELEAEADDLAPDSAATKEYGEWFAEHSRLMQEQHRISQIPEAPQALCEAWQRLTGGAYDPGGVLAPGGAMDLGQGVKP